MGVQSFKSVPAPGVRKSGAVVVGRSHASEAVVRTVRRRQTPTNEGVAVVLKLRHTVDPEHVLRASTHAGHGVRITLHHVVGEAHPASTRTGRLRLPGVQPRSHECTVFTGANGRYFFTP